MANDKYKLVCTRHELLGTSYLMRSSMHGFIFDPKTGECQSPVCFGQRLQSLRLEDIDGTLYFAEKHLTLIDERTV